jgi:hypothetical protein
MMQIALWISSITATRVWGTTAKPEQITSGSGKENVIMLQTSKRVKRVYVIGDPSGKQATMIAANPTLCLATC